MIQISGKNFEFSKDVRFFFNLLLGLIASCKDKRSQILSNDSKYFLNAIRKEFGVHKAKHELKLRLLCEIKGKI